MATGKITVAAVNKKTADAEQQREYNRSLERATSFVQRTDQRALDSIRRSQEVAGQSMFDRMSRVTAATDKSNAEFLNSRFKSFQSAQESANDQFVRRGKFALAQAAERQNQDTSLERSARAFNQQSREKTLQGLSKLTGKIGEIVEERVKQYNQGQMDQGLAEGLTEGYGVSDEDIAVVDQVRAGLAEGAASEAAVQDDLVQQGNIAQAEDQRKSSPVRRGWRAYGYSVGRARKAAAEWQTSMSTFLNNRDPMIPDPENPDTLVSAAELTRRGPAGVEAVIAAGTSYLHDRYGLKGINPVILARELTPRVNEINSNLSRGILSNNRSIEMSEEQESILTEVGQTFRGLDINDSLGASRFVNDYVDQLRGLGIDRGKANEMVIGRLAQLAVSIGDPELLNVLAVAYVSETDPSLGTWQGRYGDVFDTAYDAIDTRLVSDQKAFEAQLDGQIDGWRLERQDQLLEAGTDTAAIEQANQLLRDRLQDAASQGSDRALDLLIQENSKPLSETSQAFPAIMRAIEAGNAPTERQIEELQAQGIITPGQAASIRDLKPEDIAGDIIGGVSSTITSVAAGAVKEQADRAGVEGGRAGLGALAPALQNAYAQEIEIQLRPWIEQQLAAGRTPTPAAINGQALVIARSLQQTEEFSIRVTDGKPETVRPLVSSRFQAPAVPNGNGGISRDMSNTPAFVVRGEARTTAITLSPTELQDNQQRLQDGQPPTPRAQQVMRATGATQAQLVQQQSNIQQGDGSYDATTSPQAQRQAQQQALSPREADVVNDPRTSPVRVSRGLQRLRQRQQFRAMQDRANHARAEWARTGNLVGRDLVGDGGVGDQQIQSQALAPLLDLIAGGESGPQGYNAVNRGGAGDTPGGSQQALGRDLTSMTVGEIKQAQANGLHAVGRYQFIPSTLVAAQRAAGISDSERFTPEVQDRLTTGWILNGQRPRLSAYLRGESDDINGAQDDAATEWAALSDSKGGGRYNGLAGNSNTVSTGRTRQALVQARAQMATARNPQGFRNNRTLNRLSRGTGLHAARPGHCVTAVLETLENNGIPNPPATGNDAGNNPRGMAVQMVNSYGWEPLPIGRPTELNSPYGRSTVNTMSMSEYRSAVNSGRIPSGALVYQTRHGSWNGTAQGSSGFDVAIAQEGGRRLFNGQQHGDQIYSNTTQVFVLVPSS